MKAEEHARQTAFVSPDDLMPADAPAGGGSPRIKETSEGGLAVSVTLC